MSEQLQFKISSALKNIIGSDLISDDFIAVFELVKNAYDAHATEVEVCFIDLNTENAKIIIKDNGKGMNNDDLINKWLFVAYSAKKEGTEENSFDYRDKIKVKRAYAGAKGIGRFSCDKLGKLLYLESVKQEENPKIETLYTDWERFEGRLSDEFVNINVIHDTRTQSSYSLKHGTVLEISSLRSNWDRFKILRLKGALAKLINPNTKEFGDIFTIKIIAESEIDEDNKVKEKGKKKGLSNEAIYKDIVNDCVENLIFEELDVKTTKIVSEIPVGNRNEIVTTLYEGGKLVYRVVENNPLAYLHDIDFTIYYLNRSAKVTFAKRMGFQPVEYGHIFVYKNGLRIFPYGERGEDPLKMDNRKAQGQNRNLGTREVIGYINILNKNNELVETSSRGDGLKKTDTYTELYKWFYVTLKRLERYIIDVSDWGKDLSEDDYINLDEQEKISALRKIVSKLSKSKNFVSIEYSPDLFEILEQKQVGSARSVLSEIKEKIIKDDFDKAEVLKGIQQAETKISNLEKRTDNAEDETLENLVKREALEQKLELEKDQNKYLLATRPVSNEVFDIVHAIKISSQDMDASLNSIFTILETEKISNLNLIRELEFIKFNNDKSKLLSEFITKADLKDLKQKTWIDIPQYIKEYVVRYNKGLQTKFEISCIDSPMSFRSQISILDISIIIDNLISNSRKAEASKMLISFGETKDKKLIIDISDNGTGLSKEYSTNSDVIFKLGITNKSGGSGIGLYTLKEIIKENLQGDIFYNGLGIPPKGATFRIIIK